MKRAQNGIRFRENVWELPRWDPTLLWYARAVKAMWARALDDPTGWRYQAAIHGYDASSRQLRQLAKPGDRAPRNQADVWNQCQHFGWFFLPWHRGYLGCFEEIVRETIRGLGGPADDWALPFWDYSDSANPHARLVRPEFVEAAWPDGGPNPLFDGIRRRRFRRVATPVGQAGDFDVEPAEVSLRALGQRSFSAPPNAPSFGGSPTGFSHNQGSRPGTLEGTPHGDIHVSIGSDENTGEAFWMGTFETAALDPIFWLHHCNLDRLWDEWLRRPGSLGNPNVRQWLAPSSPVTGRRMPFILHLPGRSGFSFVPGDVLDSSRSVFAYVYDGLEALPEGREAVLETVSTEAEMAQSEPELVGATEAPLSLESGRASVRVPLSAPGGEVLESLGGRAAEAPQRLFLNIENIVSEGPPVPFRVYLNVPEGFDPEAHADHFVGTLPMFGVLEATRQDGELGGSGLSYVFDVTEVAQRVASGEDDLRVAFIPKGNDQGSAGLRIGKISFYRG